MKIVQRLLYFIGIVCLLFVVYYRVWFLRQPERNIPTDATAFISPANGKIVSIKTYNTTLLDETKQETGVIKLWTQDVDTAGTIISIQMNVANVHYQRASTDATLIDKRHVPGDYKNAVVMSNDFGIRFENEHNEMLFETTSGTKYKLIQIAGFVARRIEDYLTPDQKIKKGDVIGLIKLGSQVTVVLPKSAVVTAKVGDLVIDGESILAKID
jgi:phosphatidylserine decarboxylase